MISFIDYIDGTIILNETNNESNDDNESTSCCSDFLNTNVYGWFMGNDKIKKSYETSFYNEDELIEHLKTNACEDEINFYCETADTEKIKFVANSILKNKLEKQNEYLRKQNEQLREQIVPNIILKIDALKSKDNIYAYEFIDIFKLINDTNKYLLEDKYNELVELLYSKFDVFHYSIDEIFKITHINVINHYIEYLLIEFNKYLELPPYHKRQESNYLKITDLLNKCFKIIYDEKIIDTTNKVLDELVIVIQNIKVYNWHSHSRFQPIFKIEKIKEAYIMEYYKIIVNLENDEFQFEKDDLRQICESHIDMIKTAGLEKIIRNKDKYSDLYKKYYEC